MPEMQYDPYGQPQTPQQMTQADMNPNFTAQLLDVDKDYTEEFKKMLLGEKREPVFEEITDRKGNTMKMIVDWKWVEIDEKRKPLINATGYNEIMSFLNPYLNPLVPRSALSKETIFQMCKELEFNLLIKMAESFDLWEVHPSNIRSIVSGITYLVLISLARAEGGRTLMGLTQGSQRVEHITKDETKRGLIPNPFKRRDVR